MCDIVPISPLHTIIAIGTGISWSIMINSHTFFEIVHWALQFEMNGMKIDSCQYGLPMTDSF